MKRTRPVAVRVWASQSLSVIDGSFAGRRPRIILTGADAPARYGKGGDGNIPPMPQILRKPATRPFRDEAVELSFTTAFEGPALELGRIDARVFASSLVATAELIESAAERVHGIRQGLTVQVGSDFKRGSFEFTVIAYYALLAGQTALQNFTVTDLKTLFEILGFFKGKSKTVAKVAKEIGTGEITMIERTKSGNCNIHVDVEGDNNIVLIIPNVPEAVTDLVTDRKVRQALASLVEPMKQPGIDKLRIGTKKAPALVVNKKDVPKFTEYRQATEPLTDSTAETAVQLLSVAFVEGNKWRVKQGDNDFHVAIADPAFLKEVQSGHEAFRKGDFLIVEMRTRTARTGETMNVEREITKVLKHHSRPDQTKLFEAESDSRKKSTSKRRSG